MRLFAKEREAKARRTQELEEQQKRANAVPTPYFHTPSHALKDSLLSVPGAYESTDKERLKQAHQYRLEQEVSALAAGEDTNATKVPANYWQGQPLPAQFKAPTPAGLRKLALSRPSIKGKKVALPKTLPAQQQSQTLVDEGYASEDSLDGTGNARPRKPTGLAKRSSHKPATMQPRQDPAAEAGTEAELERLRSRVRELEAQQMGKQNEQGQPSVLTTGTVRKTSGTNQFVVAGPRSMPVRNAGSIDDHQSRTSSSEAWKWSSSEKDYHEKKSESTPPTPLSVDSGSHETNGLGDGVRRYDWAFHWARLAAQTEEERDSLPPAVNPRQRKARAAKPPPEAAFRSSYVSMDGLNRIYPAAEEGEPSRSSRRYGRARMSEQFGSGSANPNTTVRVPTLADEEIAARHTPTPSEASYFGFGSGSGSNPTSNTSRPRNYSRKVVNNVDKAKARRGQQ